MTARFEFKRGDRVIENTRAPRAARRMRDGIYRTGTIVGFSRDPNCVRVTWDGRKAVDRYHVSFLDKADGQQVGS